MITSARAQTSSPSFKCNSIRFLLLFLFLMTTTQMLSFLEDQHLNVIDVRHVKMQFSQTSETTQVKHAVRQNASLQSQQDKNSDQKTEISLQIRPHALKRADIAAPNMTRPHTLKRADIAASNMTRNLDCTSLIHKHRCTLNERSRDASSQHVPPETSFCQALVPSAVRQYRSSQRIVSRQTRIITCSLSPPTALPPSLPSFISLGHPPTPVSDCPPFPTLLGPRRICFGKVGKIGKITKITRIGNVLERLGSKYFCYVQGKIKD